MNLVKSLVGTATRRSTTLPLFLRPPQILASLINIPVCLSYAGVSTNGTWLSIAALAAWTSLGQLGIADSLVAPLATAFAQDDHATVVALSRRAGMLLSFMAVALIATITPFALQFNLAEFLQVSAQNAPQVAVTLLIAGVLAGLAIPASLPSALYQARNRSHVPIAANVVAQYVGIGAIAACDVVNVGHPLVVLCVANLAQPVASATYLVIADRSLWRQIVFTRPTLALSQTDLIKNFFNFSAFQLRVNVVNASDAVVIAHFISPQAVVTYNLASRLMTVGGGLIFTGLNPWRARLAHAIAREEFEWVVRSWRKMQLISVVSATLILSALALAGSELIPLWSGHRVKASVAILIIFGFFYLIETWNYCQFTLLAAAQRTTGLGFIAIIEAVVNLALSIVGAETMGLEGAALGTLVALTVVNVPAMNARARSLARSFTKLAVVIR